MRVLLVTHTLLWWVLGDPRLSSEAAAILGVVDTTIVVSAVSGHEIATKYRIGKLAVPARLAEQLDEVIDQNGWQPLALTIAHGQLAGRLPGVHRDPFDRMLAAQSLIEDLPIITNDAAISGFGTKMLW